MTTPIIENLAVVVAELRAKSKETAKEFARLQVNPNFSELEVSKARIAASSAMRALIVAEARLDAAVAAEMGDSNG